MPFTPVSAKAAKVRFNAATVTMAEWDVNAENPGIDITNFEGGGFYDEISSISKIMAHIAGLWDSANDNFANPPNMVDGQILTTTKLYLNDTAGSFWLLPSARVAKVHCNAKVTGGVLVDCDLVGKGTYTYP